MDKRIKLGESENNNSGGVVILKIVTVKLK